MKLISLTPEDERLLRAVAAHESGHFMACVHFNLDPLAYIASPQGAVVKFRLGCGWQHAVISWAAPMAEDLLKCRHPARTLPECELNAGTLIRWFYGMIFGGGIKQLARYSAPDAANLEGQRDQIQREAAELAFEILSARRATLEWKAERLADESRERFRSGQLRGDPAADMRELKAVAYP
jgi:hypothetical protein